MTEPENPQADRFKEAAWELGCDEAEARWDEALRGWLSALPVDERFLLPNRSERRLDKVAPPDQPQQ
jgi:hypothetical protein